MRKWREQFLDHAQERTCAGPGCDADISMRKATARFCSERCYQAATYRSNRRKMWLYLLEHPCVHCGEANPICLDFDHLDQSVKKRPVSQLLLWRWEKVLAEIEKCQVLCKNCHAIRTNEQLGYYRGEDMDFGEEVAAIAAEEPGFTPDRAA